MSKDIRSFFTVKSTTGSEKKTMKAQDTLKKFGQRKRPVIVIDSDSDEDSCTAKAKRSKSSTVNEKHGCSKKNEEEKNTSKYFSVEKVSSSNIFGARPIKRDNSRNIIKKVVTKEVRPTEFHVDKDLESELLKLDYIVPELLSKDTIKQENNPKSTEKVLDTILDKVKNNSILLNKEATNLDTSRDTVDLSELPRKKIMLENKQSLKKGRKFPKWLEGKDDFLNKEIEQSNRNKSPTKLSPSKVISSSKSLNKDSAVKYSPKEGTLNSPTRSFPIMKSPQTTNISVSQNNDLNKRNSDLKLNFLQTHCLSPERKTKYLNGKVASPMKVDTVNVKNDFSKNMCNTTLKDKKSDLDFNTKTRDISSAPYNLWVEKYKPSTTKQIIGQQGEKSCLIKLTTWLKNWQRNQSGSKKLMKPSPWAKNDDGGYFKAALLSGPPGVGKTTTAHLVCKELGFDVVEFNASDTRSKKLLHQEVSELLSTNSLCPYFTGQGEQVTKKHVLLMDEVDGMAGNEDRGGVQELIQLIKQSRVPIICMCNDRNHPKIRSLANYCFDLRFSKPRTEQIKGAMMSVCFKEKLKLTPNVLSEIIASANQDIRLIINHLSMLAIEDSSLANSTKHIKMGPWDVVRKIFSKEEHKSMSIYDKCDLFFHDYSITPLFVQENYLNAVPHKPEAKNKIKKMELFASAARSISLGDLTEKSIRSHNAWSLLPVQAIFSSLVPGEILEGHIGAQINFPGWFGKNSRLTKMSRLLQELTVHSRLKISGNKEAMNLDYLVPLEKSIVSPLVKQGLDGIAQSLNILSEYCLVREDLESLSELSSWPNTKNDFSLVESKVKAAFTRAYNKKSTPTPYAAVPIKKGSKTDFDSTDDVPEEGEDISQGLDDEEDDSLEVDAMILVKKKPSSKKIVKDVMPSTSSKSKTSKKGRKK